MKLIQMTAFVLEYYSSEEHDELQLLDLMNNYACFLTQPLTLSMFVACDDKENVLEDPGLIPSQALNDYRKAKERVLFEGFEVLYKDKNRYFITNESQDVGFFVENINHDKIEDLVQMELTLTPTAIKQIGL